MIGAALLLQIQHRALGRIGWADAQRFDFYVDTELLPAVFPASIGEVSDS